MNHRENNQRKSLSGIFGAALVATLVCGATAIEIDLTKGNAGSLGKVTGGVWNNGWQTTSNSSQRIVFDLGKVVSSGSVELQLTLSGSPHQGDKINYFGIYELSSLSHYNSGHKAYMRVGEAKYAFSRLKAETGPFVRGTTPEPSVGSTSDWKTDGSINTIKITWGSSDIKFAWNGKAGATLPRKITKVRYIFIGTDNNYNRCLKATYKKVTIDAAIGSTENRFSGLPANGLKNQLQVVNTGTGYNVSFYQDAIIRLYDLQGTQLSQINAQGGQQYSVNSFGRQPIVFRAASSGSILSNVTSKISR